MRHSSPADHRRFMICEECPVRTIDFASGDTHGYLKTRTCPWEVFVGCVRGEDFELWKEFDVNQVVSTCDQVR